MTVNTVIIADNIYLSLYRTVTTQCQYVTQMSVFSFTLDIPISAITSWLTFTLV